MDILNIFVIAGQGWSKPKIIADIEGEGYKHNFFFSQGQDWDILEREIKKADEIWCWGHCEGYQMYEYAKIHSMDLWKMG